MILQLLKSISDTFSFTFMGEDKNFYKKFSLTRFLMDVTKITIDKQTNKIVQ